MSPSAARSRAGEGGAACRHAGLAGAREPRPRARAHQIPRATARPGSQVTPTSSMRYGILGATIGCPSSTSQYLCRARACVTARPQRPPGRLRAGSRGDAGGRAVSVPLCPQARKHASIARQQPGDTDKLSNTQLQYEDAPLGVRAL